MPLSPSISGGSIPLPDEIVESVTVLLGEAREGRADAWDRIYALIYRELRQIASFQLRQGSQSQSPTSLISAAWLRLAGAAFSAESRQHLVSLVARAMRYVILDEAKKARAVKHGMGIKRVEFNEEECPPDETIQIEQLVLLDQLIRQLASLDARMATIVELRQFGNLTHREIGELLGIHERTVRREWEIARGFLLSRLSDDR